MRERVCDGESTETASERGREREPARETTRLGISLSIYCVVRIKAEVYLAQATA